MPFQKQLAYAVFPSHSDTSITVAMVPPGGHRLLIVYHNIFKMRLCIYSPSSSFPFCWFVSVKTWMSHIIFTNHLKAYFDTYRPWQFKFSVNHIEVILSASVGGIYTSFWFWRHFTSHPKSLFWIIYNKGTSIRLISINITILQNSIIATTGVKHWPSHPKLDGHCQKGLNHKLIFDESTVSFDVQSLFNCIPSTE